MSRVFRFDFILLGIISFLVTFIWFHNGLIKGGGEEGLMFYDLSKTFELSKNMVWDYNGGFPTLAWLSKLTSLYPLYILDKFFLIPPFLLQAATYFILLLVGGISVYLLTRDLLWEYDLKNKVSLVAGFFYIANPFSFSQIWSRGLYSQHFSFALLPLGIWLFWRGLIKKDYKYFIYFIFSSLIFSASFGISTFVMTFWAVLFFVFLYWVFIKCKTFKDLWFGLGFFILTITFWALTNSWWFLPTITSGSEIYAGKVDNLRENLGTLLGLSGDFSPILLIRLLQKHYFFNLQPFGQVYSSVLFQLISFLLPLFLILGFAVFFKKRKFGDFGLLLVIFFLGLVVSLGANMPFGWLFVWVFKQFPALQSFRNPYEKFGIVYALAYSSIFALGLVYFFESKIKKIKPRLIGLIGVLFLTCGVYAWPLWTQNLMAGSDTRIGLSIPNYYQSLNEFLNKQSSSYRLFMAPIMSGDGAYYQWGSSKYIGIDPTMYLFDKGVISSTPRLPYYYDFMQKMRENILKQDLSSIPSLFGAKYLAARQDNTDLSSYEKNHEKYLTDSIYPPMPSSEINLNICQNMQATASENVPAQVYCELQGVEGDWSNFRYLHIVVKTDEDSNLELAIRDNKNNRPRWYGQDDQYFIPANIWTDILIPLSSPQEINNNTDFSKIALLELMAHPKNSPSTFAKKIEIKNIGLDSGVEKKLNRLSLLTTFGKINLYQATNFNSPPEFGVLTTIENTNSFEELFKKVDEKYAALDKTGFVMVSQNKEKDLSLFPNTRVVKVLDSKKISETKYHIKLSSSDPTYIILNKSYNPQWKLIPGADESFLSGFFNQLKVIKSDFLSEDNHYVINGYANLWVLNNQDKAVIVFLPQIYSEIGMRVSVVSVAVLILIFGGLFIKKRLR